MKLVQITKEIEQALTAVCHAALKATGLEHLAHVNQIAQAIQAAPEVVSQEPAPEAPAEQPQA